MLKTWHDIDVENWKRLEKLPFADHFPNANPPRFVPIYADMFPEVDIYFSVDITRLRDNLPNPPKYVFIIVHVECSLFLRGFFDLKVVNRIPELLSQNSMAYTSQS